AVAPGATVVVAARRGRQRCRQREHHERQQAAFHSLVASFARASTAPPRSPEAAAAVLAPHSIVVPQVTLPCSRFRTAASSSRRPYSRQGRRGSPPKGIRPDGSLVRGAKS